MNNFRNHPLLLILLGTISPVAAASNNSPNRSEPKCISVDSYHTYVCTDDPEASRRAVASTIADGGSSSSAVGGVLMVESPFDMDLGVEQRITGSETEQLRIRNVLRKMYTYFEDEVLTRSEYEHIRGIWCVRYVIS